MIENDFITIIDGIENLDSNLMGMLHGGLSSNMNDCNCGSGNSNTEQTEHGSNDCTCGSGNSNKIAAPSDWIIFISHIELVGFSPVDLIWLFIYF